MRLPIVDAIIDERRPKTQEKGKEMASARGPMSATWYKGVIKYSKWQNLNGRLTCKVV